MQPRRNLSTSISDSGSSFLDDDRSGLDVALNRGGGSRRVASGAKHVERARRHVVILVGLVFTGGVAGWSFRKSLTLLEEARTGLAEKVVYDWHVRNQDRDFGAKVGKGSDPGIGKWEIREELRRDTCAPGSLDCNCLAGWVFHVARDGHFLWERKVPCGRILSLVQQSIGGENDELTTEKLRAAARRAGIIDVWSELYFVLYRRVEESILGPSGSLEWLKPLGLTASAAPNVGLRLLSWLIVVILISLSHLVRVASVSKDAGVGEPWIMVECQCFRSTPWEYVLAAAGYVIVLAAPLVSLALVLETGQAHQSAVWLRSLEGGGVLLVGIYSSVRSVVWLLAIRRARIVL